MTVRIPTGSPSNSFTLHREQALFFFQYLPNRGGYEICNMEIRLVDHSLASPLQMAFEFEHNGNRHTILMMPNEDGRILSIEQCRDLWQELVRTGWKHL
jgi:hypothetical protein